VPIASPELVLLIGNPRAGSRTRAVAERFASRLGVVPCEVLELAELTGVTYGAFAVAPAISDEAALDRVRAARLLVVATPSYKGTYTGLLKLFLDRVPHLGLDGVVAVPIAVAASPAHAAATGADLARLLRELGAHVPVEVPVLESELETADLDRAAGLVRAEERVPHSADRTA